jgi:O-antigen/teichoic acid export membrane protein
MVQSPRGNDPQFLNTAWTVQAVRGMVLTAVLWLIALALSLAGGQNWLPEGKILGDPRLPPLIAVISLTVLLGSFQSMSAWRAGRNLHVGKIMLIELAGQAIALVAMVIAAWYTRSYWSLALGALLAPMVARTLEYWLLPGHQHRFARDAGALSEIRAQARWILPASALGFFALHSERLILGALLDTSSFGLYAIAFLLATAMAQLPNTVATRIVFPSLSEVQRERPHDLPRVLARFQWLYDGCFVTLFAAVAVCGSTLVDLLYDDRYRAAGPMLTILAIGCIGTRALVVEQCYLAQGLPVYTAVNQAFRMVVLLPAMYLGYRLGGTHGALMGIAVAQFAGWPVVFVYQMRRNLFTWSAQALLLPALLAGAGLGWLAVQAVHWFKA